MPWACASRTRPIPTPEPSPPRHSRNAGIVGEAAPIRKPSPLAGRFALAAQCTSEQLRELKGLAGGKTAELSADLLHACDADAQLDAASRSSASPSRRRSPGWRELRKRRDATDARGACSRSARQTGRPSTGTPSTPLDFDAAALPKRRRGCRTSALDRASRDHLTALQVLYASAGRSSSSGPAPVARCARGAAAGDDPTQL